MPRIKEDNIINHNGYLFEGQANLEGEVQKAVITQLEKHQVGAKVSVEKMKSGGMIMGSREEVIVLRKGGFNPIYIITRTVGDFLYVSILTMAKYDFSKVTNIFQTETLSAYWSACTACLDDALSSLGMNGNEGRIMQ